MLMKRLRIILIVVAVVAFLYFLVGGPRGVVQSYKLYTNVQRLERELDDTQTTIDSLRNEVERLKNDTAYIEHLARQKLGMARRDEKIYKFVEEK
ncbi:MAG: hypothetical protein GF331_09450 [Chitinivibrionales bacterium]|nr:hypothetical protein [Chitinivibrionales bacterium]